VLKLQNQLINSKAMRITATIEVFDLKEFSHLFPKPIDEKLITVNIDVEGIKNDSDAKFLEAVSKKMYHVASEIKSIAYTK